jgi:hypothetical protein
MDGQVLVDALDTAHVAENPVRLGQEARLSGMASHDGEALTAEEEADVQARLKGLGYL